MTTFFPLFYLITTVHAYWLLSLVPLPCISGHSHLVPVFTFLYKIVPPYIPIYSVIFLESNFMESEINVEMHSKVWASLDYRILM